MSKTIVLPIPDNCGWCGIWAPASCDGEDGLFRIIGARFCQPSADVAFNHPNGERVPIGCHQNVVVDRAAAQQICHFPHHAGGDLPHLADALHFVGSFCQACPVEHTAGELSDEMHLGQQCLQCADQGVNDVYSLPSNGNGLLVNTMVALHLLIQQR